MDKAKITKVESLQEHLIQWITNFERAKLESDSELAKEANEMREMLTKTEQILEKVKQKESQASTETASSTSEWKKSYDSLLKTLNQNAFFATCFEAADDLLKKGEEVTDEVIKLAAKAKEEASNWYGQFFDGEDAPQDIKAAVAAIHDRAKEILTAKKNQEKSGQDDLVIRFFGANKGDSQKVAKYIDQIAEKFAGKINIEKFEDKGETDFRKKYNIEHLPTIIFKRGGKEFARHEGEISASELEKKANMMVEGASFSNSSKVVTMDGQRTMSDRELFSLGEFVVIYFDTVWSGACKKVGDSVKDEVLTLATKSNKTTTIKYQNVTIDGRTQIHKKFHVDKVPTIIYLRDGNMVGKHEGYINPSTLKEDMRRFLANGKVGESSSNEVDLLGVEYDQKKASSSEVLDNIPDKLSGSVGDSGKNTEMDVYAVQILLAKNGFNLKADGQVGSELIYALKAFQASLGLESSGIIKPGDDCWAALNGKKITPPATDTTDGQDTDDQGAENGDNKDTV
jgi:thioredoxin-like negative regulator of GroEL